MTKSNFRLTIVEREGGKNAGHIDIYGDCKEVLAGADSLGSSLGDNYIVMVGRCPKYDNIEDKLDQIVQLLKNRRKK